MSSGDKGVRISDEGRAAMAERDRQYRQALGLVDGAPTDDPSGVGTGTAAVGNGGAP